MNAFRNEGAKEWMEMPQDLMFGATWSLPQLLIVLLLVVLLFGKGKVSDLMGDVAKGIKSFKKGLADEDSPAPPQSTQAASTPKPLDHEAARTEAKTPTGTETKA
jgi:sec-independent protein translocase protein TatA